MRLLKNAIKNRRTEVSAPQPRRQSAAPALDLHFYQEATEKSPAVVMFPRDSASSLPPSPAVRSPVPHGPYCFKRPNLSEILADESHEPWSLAAFTEYCQQNLCLENLNFIMQAKEYRQLYDDWALDCSVPPSQNDIERGAILAGPWNQLISEYITPGGQQEINLPGDVRQGLTSIPPTNLPIDPDVLKPAVRKIRELMQDSILLSFLNDIRPPSVSEDQMCIHDDMPQEEPRVKSRSIQIAPQHQGSPTRGSGFAYAPSGNSLFHKRSTTSNSSSRHHPSTSSHHSLHDDIADSPSSTGEFGSGSGYHQGSGRDSTQTPPPLAPLTSSQDHRRPLQKMRSDSGWKKFGAKLGLKKGRGGKDNEQAIIDDEMT